MPIFSVSNPEAGGRGRLIQLQIAQPEPSDTVRVVFYVEQFVYNSRTSFKLLSNINTLTFGFLNRTCIAVKLALATYETTKEFVKQPGQLHNVYDVCFNSLYAYNKPAGRYDVSKCPRKHLVCTRSSLYFLVQSFF